ncbi:unnamed protein product [Diamesa tonsa]
MDQVKSVSTSFNMDIAEYLLLICDYGKPNYKYFNFLWNRMGFQFLFVYKDKVFKNRNLGFEFCDLCLESLKKIFLMDKSILKRSAIIYLFCKLYFTDKTVSLLKLRVSNEEFIEFKAFVEIISKVPAYQTVQIMFWQLFVENFFRFSLKSTILSLDFGKMDHFVEEEKQMIESAEFWNDIKKEINNLNACEVEELKELDKVHTELIKSFDTILPESDNLNRALEEFEELKTTVENTTLFLPKIIRNRRIMSQQYKEFIQSKNNKDDSDDSLTKQPLARRKTRKYKKRVTKETDSDSSVTSTDSQFNPKRSDYHAHNISKAFGETSGEHANMIDSGDCSTDSLAIYKIELEGHWSQELFPKHYPLVRPPAHFSKTFGQTHDNHHALFNVGKVAGKSLKHFCNNGQSVELENEDTGEFFDEFHIPLLKNPTDRIESRLFVNSNYTMISLVTKLIPSPDWFIGIDSLNLCKDKKWIEKLTIPVTPYDCGVNSGLTFSAPIWPSDPQETIQKITPIFPRHQASSFYYKEMHHLPAIATFHVELIKEYVGVQEKKVKRIHQKFRRHDKNNKESRNKLANDRRSNRHKSQHRKKPNQLNSTNNIHDTTTHVPLKEEYESPDCVVSEWAEFTACSKSCGVGVKKRTRTVITVPKIGGSACPTLKETLWCGSAKCQEDPNAANNATGSSSYFNW